jgi:NAD(P)-dependent dehydrogenase (short-subunit alcohol dehydrogenase family)
MTSAPILPQNPVALLPGKVALVTGAASGIGRAIALACAREGAKVVVSDTDAAGGEETVAQVRRMPGDAVFVRADVSVATDCERLVARCIEAYGRLDMACNNAGIGGDLAATADYPLDAWQRVIGVNLTGVFHCMKYEIPELLKTRGSIVNVASILGAVGFAHAPAYTAAKHGVLGLTKAAAIEYSAQGVRINAVGPAWRPTRRHSPNWWRSTRSAGWVSRTRWPNSCCGWARTVPPSAPGRTTRWMAASWRTERLSQRRCCSRCDWHGAQHSAAGCDISRATGIGSPQSAQSP